jgi:hypothetical protein
MFEKDEHLSCDEAPVHHNGWKFSLFLEVIRAHNDSTTSVTPAVTEKKD